MKLNSYDFDLSKATWHKSSYSGGDGDNCVEMGTWRKSTYSGPSGGDCLEVRDGNPDIVPVRDSKVTDGPALVFRTGAWSAFVTTLKHTHPGAVSVLHRADALKRQLRQEGFDAMDAGELDFTEIIESTGARKGTGTTPTVSV